MNICFDITPYGTVEQEVDGEPVELNTHELFVTVDGQRVAQGTCKIDMAAARESGAPAMFIRRQLAPFFDALAEVADSGATTDKPVIVRPEAAKGGA